MFFSAGPDHQDNFSCHYRLGPFAVSTDTGWKQHENNQHSCVYKGYVDTAALDSVLDQVCQQSDPELLGNFCVIVFDRATEQLRIQTDRLRSFPIYIGNDRVTNLVPDLRTAWTDSLVAMSKDFVVTESKFDVIGDIDTTPLTVDEVLNQIHSKLTAKTQQFLKFNSVPIKTFLSGGVDSLLVYSYLQSHCDSYDLVKCNIVEYDRFWLKNSGDISRHWAYNQIHHWVNPCVLTSGAPGDEFMLRSPSTADLFLKYHGVCITDLLSQQTWLHSEYFGQQKHLQLFDQQTIDLTMSTQQLHRYLCNIIVNDWQHWHLGHTLTWTPLRDLEIFKLLLRLPVNSAVSQIMNSYISLELIRRNRPELTQLISDQKNTGNMMSNLSDFLLQSS